MAESISTFYEHAKKRAIQEIGYKSDEYILTVDATEFVRYLSEQFALQPIQRDTQRQKSLLNYSPVRPTSSNSTIAQETIVADIWIPVLHHDSINKTIEREASSSFWSNPSLPKVHYSRSNRVLNIRVVLSGLDEEINRETLQHNIELFEKMLEEWNTTIVKENILFKNELQSHINNRKQLLVNQQAHMERLAKLVDIVLIERENDLKPVVDLKIQKTIKPLVSEPIPKQPEEYRLRDNDVELVLSYIKTICTQFEIAPAVYNKLTEPDLRMIILCILNTVLSLDGQATGETFSKKGKADIFLNIPKGGILIAECKKWNSKSDFHKAINQLFRYLTWRQNHGIIINFCTRKDFTALIKRVPNFIEEHSTYTGKHSSKTDTHFIANHFFPDDRDKIIRVHYLFFNLFSGN